MIFGILVDAPDVVNARSGDDIFDRQHRGHHRMVLVVIAVHPVAPDQMQVGMRRFQFLAHRGNVLGIVLVIDRIGFFLPHDRAAEHLFSRDQPELREFAGRKVDQFGVRHRPQPVALKAEVFKADAGDPRFGHHFRRP